MWTVTVWQDGKEIVTASEAEHSGAFALEQSAYRLACEKIFELYKYNFNLDKPEIICTPVRHFILDRPCSRCKSMALYLKSLSIYKNFYDLYQSEPIPDYKILYQSMLVMVKDIGCSIQVQ